MLYKKCPKCSKGKKNKKLNRSQVIEGGFLIPKTQ